MSSRKPIKISKVMAIYFWLLALFCTACTGQAYPEEQELKEALQRAEQLSLSLELTGDTFRLSEAFTEKTIVIIEQELARELEYSDQNNLYEQTIVEDVTVLEYNPPEVMVIAKYGYELFVQNRVTGEQAKAVPPQRGWRTWKVRMVQENGGWKYDETLEFLDWGPRYD